jgi:hypothetical protein
MEYNVADSMTISAALIGWRVVPGNRETRKIRATMMSEQRRVVAKESVILVMLRALKISSENMGGITLRIKWTNAAAEDP